MGAIRRFGMVPFVKLNPRNFRSHGRATALFSRFTFSLSLPSRSLSESPHQALPRSLTADVDVAIVRISNKTVPSSLQLPVKLVENEIRQQWR